MKKLAIAAALPTLLLAGTAQADTFLGLYVGAQVWDTSNSGQFGSGNGNQGFDFTDEKQTSFYAAFEHPIPLLPNIKIRENELVTYGLTTLNQDFTFNGQVYSANDTINSYVDLSHTDLTLYYELLDNDLVSLDLGLTGKKVDGWLSIREGTYENGIRSDGWVPTGYAHLRVGIPMTGFTLYGLANAVSIDDSDVRDLEVGVEYRLVDSLALDLNLQVGYRDIQIELDGLDGIDSDLKFKGPYLGLEIHF